MKDIVNGNNPRHASAQQVQNTALATNCFVCESTNGDANDGCLSKPNKKEACASHYCYIHISDEGVLRRGCVNAGDRHVPDPKSCDNQKDKCVVCSDRENCNDKSYQLEYCFKMEYTMTNAIPPNEKMSKECQLTMDQLGCYHLEKQDVIEKGCLSETSAQKKQECQNGEECELCFGKNCNSKVVRHLDCYNCDNTTDINCAEPSDQIEREDFSYLSSSCLVGIDNHGLTHRSWGSNKTYDTKRFPKGFELCYNDLCNSNTYPSNRLKCYQCHGNAACNLNTPESKEILQPNACRIYSQNERCFIYSDEGNKLILELLTSRFKYMYFFLSLHLSLSLSQKRKSSPRLFE